MKISVVIPTYNYAHYLPFALDSALAQSRPADEIIVVDDGSTDNTRDVVAPYVSAHPATIRYVYQPNAGLSAARNTGTEVATGDWIAYLDSDDIWDPDKLRKQESAIENTPGAVVAYTGLLYLHPDGELSEGDPAVPANRVWPRLRAKNLLTASSAMARRDAVLAAGGFNETLRSCEDWDLWVRLQPYGRFAAALERLTIVRQTPSSMSSNAQRMIDNMELIREKTLLRGLRGLSRLIWTGRIRSVAHMHAAITSGLFDRRLERHYLLNSIRYWPSPFYEPRRFRVLLRNLVGPKVYGRLTSALRRSGAP